MPPLLPLILTPPRSYERHWRVTGGSRRRLLAYLARLDRAFGRINAWARAQGGMAVYARGGRGTNVAIYFQASPALGLWRAARWDPNYYEPRRTTAAGRALAAELAAIRRTAPTGPELARLLGRRSLSGGSRSMPGIFEAESTLLLVATGDCAYAAPRRLRSDLRRVSELEYERLMAKKNAA